jgi:hypothetical protein
MMKLLATSLLILCACNSRGADLQDAAADPVDAQVDYESVEGADYFVRFEIDGSEHGYAHGRSQYTIAFTSYGESGGTGTTCPVAVGTSFSRAAVSGVFGSGPDRGELTFYLNHTASCASTFRESFIEGQGPVAWGEKQSTDFEGVVLELRDRENRTWLTHADQPSENRFEITRALIDEETIIWEGHFDATMTSDQGETRTLRGATFRVPMRSSLF